MVLASIALVFIGILGIQPGPVAAALAVLMIVVLGTLTLLIRYFTRSTSAFKEI